MPVQNRCSHVDRASRRSDEALPGTAVVVRKAGQEAGLADVVEAADKREIVGFGLRALLPTAAKALGRKAGGIETVERETTALITV